MEKFVIVHDSVNDNLSIMLKEEYQSNIYRYEPIAAEHTLKKAQQLMFHFQKLGIQGYFQEIEKKFKGKAEADE